MLLSIVLIVMEKGGETLHRDFIPFKHGQRQLQLLQQKFRNYMSKQNPQQQSGFHVGQKVRLIGSDMVNKYLYGVVTKVHSDTRFVSKGAVEGCGCGTIYLFAMSSVFLAEFHILSSRNGLKGA